MNKLKILFLMFCMFVTHLTFAATITGGTTVASNVFTGFGWKPASAASNNITLTFNAIATTDLHVGLQYNSSTNSYVEIVIGGWNNTQSAVRNYTNGGISSQYLGGFVTKTMPETMIPVAYTLTIAPVAGSSNSLLTVTAKTSAGVVSTILSYQVQYLNQMFSAYSYRIYANTFQVGQVVFVSGTPIVDYSAQINAALITAKNVVDPIISLVAVAVGALNDARGSLTTIASQISDFALSTLPW